MVKAAVRVAEAASATWTVKEYDPTVVGVPLMVPFVAKDRPGGNEPAVTLQV
jgi:hypothetical protein